MSDVLILTGFFMFIIGTFVGIITTIVLAIKKRSIILKFLFVWIVYLVISFLMMYIGANLPEPTEEISNGDVLEENELLSQEDTDEESNIITLKEESYDLSYGSVRLSVKQNTENERILYITAMFEEDWQAAGFYMNLALFYKQWDSEKNGLNIFFLIKGEKVWLTPLASLYDSQSINGAEWAIEQITNEEYNLDVIELIWDEFSEKLIEFSSDF